jgi:hypothetical protein
MKLVIAIYVRKSKYFVLFSMTIISHVQVHLIKMYEHCYGSDMV